MQFSSGKRYLWRDYVVEYMEEIYEKGVKYKEKELSENVHKGAFINHQPIVRFQENKKVRKEQNI